MKKGNIYKISALIILLSFFVVPFTFTLYRESIMASGSLVAAEWSVTLEQNGVNNSLIVVPEVATATYTLNVKSLSQVDVKYNIVVSGLPSGIDVSLNGVDYPTVTSGTVTFTNAGTILGTATDRINTHTLTFRGANGATFVNNQTITVNVYAEQLLS